MKFVRSGKTETSSNASTRLGELLVAAHVIREQVLSESLVLAERSKTKIGQTLVGLGQIDESKLQAALEIQSLIRNHSVSTEFGLRTLSLACTTKISVKEALAQLGWKAPIKSAASESGFAWFMIQAGVVSSSVLEQVQKQSAETKRPLGQCLVLSRTIPRANLSAVLSAQVLLKEGKISQDQAIDAVKTSLKKHQTLERSLFELGLRNIGETEIRIGDLLSTAGLLTDGDRLNALEVALTSEKKMGEILIELNMISKNTLENALKLQNLIRSGYISVQQAANFLKRFQAQALSEEAVTFAIEGKGKNASRLEQVLDLLINTKVLSVPIVEEAKKKSENEKKSIGEILLSQCKIDQHYLDAAWEAQRLIDDKIITNEQAAILLLKISASNLNFEEALDLTLKESDYRSKTLDKTAPPLLSKRIRQSILHPTSLLKLDGYTIC